MSYTLTGRIQSRLVATLPPLLLALAIHRWWALELVALMLAFGLALDLCIYDRKLMLEDVKGPDLLLVIEVADSTLAFDLGPKAQLYASYGVQELWVVNARTRTTTVHTGATATGWASVREVGPADLLPMAALPGLILRLIELPT